MDKNLMMDLIDRATVARNRAYAKYSNFKVGVALLTKTDKIYTASNVENAVNGLSVCAEHSAFIKAVNDGENSFKAIAIVGGVLDINSPCLPCGSCRQVMAEFCDGDFIIICVNDGKILEYKLKDLLPNSFGLK